LNPGGQAQPISKILFDKNDRNHSGSISRAEFHDLCYSLGHYLKPEEAEQAFLMIDNDGSGGITYDEFLKWWRTDNRFEKLQRSDEEQALLHQCASYFQYFDKDRSGTLQTDEFRDTHADLVKNGFTAKSFEETLRELDSNGDGTITYNEFIHWLISIGSIKAKTTD